MAMKHVRNVDKCIALNVILQRGVYDVYANVLVHFQNGGHEPEVVISQHLRHLAGRCIQKTYFVAPAHAKSDGMHAGSVRHGYALHESLRGQTGSSFL